MLAPHQIQNWPGHPVGPRLLGDRLEDLLDLTVRVRTDPQSSSAPPFVAGCVPLSVTFRDRPGQDTFRTVIEPSNWTKRHADAAAGRAQGPDRRRRRARRARGPDHGWGGPSPGSTPARCSTSRSLLRGGELLLVGGVSLATATPRATRCLHPRTRRGRRAGIAIETGGQLPDRAARRWSRRPSGVGPAPDRAAPVVRFVEVTQAINGQLVNESVRRLQLADQVSHALAAGLADGAEVGRADDHPRGGGERRRHPHRAERRGHRRGPRRPPAARSPRRRTTRSSRRSAAPA